MFQKLCEIRKDPNAMSNLCWDKSLEKVYNYAAWIVACHNIWFIDQSDKTKAIDCILYELLGLDDLILTDKGYNYKMKCRQCPIFYLFCIIDTIEAIKVAFQVDELSKISIAVSGYEIEIDVSCAMDKERLAANIKSLNTWIANVEITDNHFKIKL